MAAAATKTEAETTDKGTTSKDRGRTISRCPRCSATRFQRIEEGKYLDGKWALDVIRLSCQGCGLEFDETALVEVPVL